MILWVSSQKYKGLFWLSKIIRPLHFSLARSNADGSLDSSFDGDGKVLTAIGPSGDLGYSLALQADNKILLAGYSYNGGDYDFALARFLPDGTLDSSFDGDGKLITEMDYAGGEENNSVVVQANGNFVVAGISDADFSLARYNSDGSLDGSFGSGGKVSTGVGNFLGNDAADFGASLGLQSNGKLVVAGCSKINGQDQFSLLRFLSNGALDTGFGDDGKISTAFGTGNAKAHAISIQADNKILVAGETSVGSKIDFALARYNANGTLDTSFSGDGKVTTTVGSSSGGHAVVIQPDGKILVAGTVYSGADSNFAIVRYLSNDTLDTAFSADGKASIGLSAGDDEGYDLALQADSKILVTGKSNNPSFGDFGDFFALVRLNADGSLDPTFGNASSANTLDTPTQFVAGGPAVILDNSVAIYDAELAARGHYAGASVTLVRSGLLARTADVFAETGSLSFVGTGVRLSGLSIGSLNPAKSGVGALEITFNANATHERVNAALSTLTYRNTSLTPPASVRINWTFADGNTGAQGAGGELSTLGSTRININADLNETPYFRVDGGTEPDILANTADYSVGGFAVVLGGNVQVFDADLSSLGNYQGAARLCECRGSIFGYGRHQI